VEIDLPSGRNIKQMTPFHTKQNPSLGITIFGKSKAPRPPHHAVLWPVESHLVQQGLKREEGEKPS